MPELLEVHEIPSDEVRMVPVCPTTTKALFPYMTPQSVFEMPEPLEVQVLPLSGEVSMVPFAPTATKVLFP